MERKHWFGLGAVALLISPFAWVACTNGEGDDDFPRDDDDDSEVGDDDDAHGDDDDGSAGACSDSGGLQLLLAPSASYSACTDTFTDAGATVTFQNAGSCSGSCAIDAAPDGTTLQPASMRLEIRNVGCTATSATVTFVDNGGVGTVRMQLVGNGGTALDQQTNTTTGSSESVTLSGGTELAVGIAIEGCDTQIQSITLN